VFEPLVALLVEKLRLTLGSYELVSGISPAARSAPSTGQQHAKTEHRHRAYHDPEEKQRAC
jgi:hypothetical protein